MPRKTRKERFLKHAYALKEYHHMVDNFKKCNIEGTYTMILVNKQTGDTKMIIGIKSYAVAAEQLKLFGLNQHNKKFINRHLNENK